MYERNKNITSKYKILFRWKHNNKSYDQVRTITFMYPLEEPTQRYIVCALQKYVKDNSSVLFRTEIEKALNPVCCNIQKNCLV